MFSSVLEPQFESAEILLPNSKYVVHITIPNEASAFVRFFYDDVCVMLQLLHLCLRLLWHEYNYHHDVFFRSQWRRKTQQALEMFSSIDQVVYTTKYAFHTISVSNGWFLVMSWKGARRCGYEPVDDWDDVGSTFLSSWVLMGLSGSLCCFHLILYARHSMPHSMSCWIVSVICWVSANCGPFSMVSNKWPLAV